MSEATEFEAWHAAMRVVIVDWKASLPDPAAARLDGSLRSLAVVERLLLERYPDIEATEDRAQARFLDGAARYIGEALREALGGRWALCDAPHDAYNGLPVLTGFATLRTTVCPLTLVTAVTDRRTGRYLTTVAQNLVKRSA